MAYTSGGLILDNHYNDFVSNGANNLNVIWGPGTGDKGYGQTNIITPVSPGDLVTATQWATFLNRVESAAAHQGSTVTSYAGPAAGSLISAVATITTDIGTITTNRTNMAGALVDQAAPTASSSGSATWTSSTVHTFNINFAGGNEARYFFNSGGEIWFNVTSNAGGAGNTKEIDWENTVEIDVGTIKMDANTITRTGSGAINTSLPGYYGLSGSGNVILFKMFANSGQFDYNNNYVQLECNSTTHSDALGNKGASLAFKLSLIDAAGDNFNDTISNLFTSNVVIKKPNPANLNNEGWGVVSDTFGAFTQT